MRRFALTAVCCLALSLLTVSCYSFDVHILNKVDKDPCADPPVFTPGGTELLTMTWGLRTDMNDGGIRSALAQQFPEWDDTNATYHWATSSLVGDVWVDSYEAFDDHAMIQPKGGGSSYYGCMHGCKLEMHYVWEGPDPVNMEWIQVFTESGGAGSRVNTVDPPSTEPGEDDRPFYYNAGDNPGGYKFSDSPYNAHPEVTCWAGAVTFTTFLASWKDDEHDLTLRDAITWGWKGKCVPEPYAVVLALIGLLGIAGRKRR